MPTSAIVTYSNQKLEPALAPNDARCIAVNLPPSVSYAKGTVLGELTATPGTYKAYASGNSDGSQNAKVILAYDAQTDASGNITQSSLSGQTAGEFGQTAKSVDAYYQGKFFSSELVGLDAAGLAAMGGHYIQGSGASGIVEIG